jgi:hypothetical protein
MLMVSQHIEYRPRPSRKEWLVVMNAIRDRLRWARKIYRVRRHVLYDRIVRPEARLATDVPWAPEAITTEWLNATVAPAFPGAAVVSSDLGPGSSGTSVRRQLSLKWSDGAPPEAPRSLFMKTCPSFVTRMANSAGGVAVAEGNFYRLLRPKLDIEAPLGYFSAFDPVSCRSIHLLEDLVATKQASFCNWKTAIDRPKAESVVDLLAKTHGRFYGDPELEAMSGWMRTTTQWIVNGFVRSGFDKNHREAFVVGADLMPADMRDAGQRSFDAVLASLEMHDKLPRTLVHSDVHLGNWYTTGDGRMGLCDWQCISRGHWARDLAYAVATVLTVEDRRAWERELVRRYADALSEAAGQRFDEETVFDAYRRQMPAALLMWTTTLVPAPTMPDMQPLEMSKAMMTRLTHAVSDLQSLSLFD